jgi:hypothetical protein
MARPPPYVNAGMNLKYEGLGLLASWIEKSIEKVNIPEIRMSQTKFKINNVRSSSNNIDLQHRMRVN